MNFCFETKLICYLNLKLLPGDRRAIVKQNADVNAHDCNNASNVQIHHKDSLKQRIQLFLGGTKLKIFYKFI
jgi:hypothetical protein